MKVNETFLSLQGEGYFTGTPAFFLRLSGCNLKCSFCDTQHQTYREMTEDEILLEAVHSGMHHIVITGGEPALQLTQSLVDSLHRAGLFVQVETNGTLPLPDGIDWVTCSPKALKVLSNSQTLSNSPLKGEKPGKGLKIDELKVLYKGEGDNPERLLESLPFGGDGREPRLYLQPLDTGDAEQNRAILNSCIDYIMQHPRWRLSLQTHKLLGIK